MILNYNIYKLDKYNDNELKVFSVYELKWPSSSLNITQHSLNYKLVGIRKGVV